ncbi:MAG: hypothetical protein M3N45_04930 [Actinomycetota bacterium]|nr:hypothetical protein [Actinomycetota bacterium]
MSSSNLIRLGGLAAVVSGVLFVIAELLYLVVGMSPPAEDLNSGTAVVQGVLFLLGGMLLVGGLIGLYINRKDELGILGAAGFIVAFAGSTFAIGAFSGGAFVVPALAELAPDLVEAGPPPLVMFADVTAFALLTLGWLLLGLAFLRSRVYPRWAAILLMVGAVIAFFPLPFSMVPFGAAVAWAGFSLLSEGAPWSGAAPARGTTEGGARVR